MGCGDRGTQQSPLRGELGSVWGGHNSARGCADLGLPLGTGLVCYPHRCMCLRSLIPPELLIKGLLSATGPGKLQ